MGPLSLFISQRERKDQLQTDFSIVDKIVIILEIASAMKDLHFYGLLHGNLSCKNIFLSSSKDAYIGSISFDRKREMMCTRLHQSFYTRSPEICNEIYINNDQDMNNLDYIKYKSSDIFSFGVVMHEILTEISPEKRFRKKKLSRNSVIILYKRFNIF